MGRWISPTAPTPTPTSAASSANAWIATVEFAPIGLFTVTVALSTRSTVPSSRGVMPIALTDIACTRLDSEPCGGTTGA